ncbi:MAG: 50S ribosomal protein L2 [Candidatus Parvarchaeota archaeon]|nr:50S ribosomal protein L2 [Candidatus Jingweiarchaeum tengchongense]MCW1297802.1 50S ribosomal protein L2 [Candidatus Jingweiarchaeum tengchongense]MCW1299812.1 50S ribosomal protein L2 [Candidatus Jingweiarchaeum tengchongense]MCW1304217.1 50S ribosomal protein L2 [Candidatus Jingweiarchaeum tengchongense]MCW1305245.1 50S ribosomal protein L2 [Candidatus Jingweiarchaeum tengchongense]
MTHRIKQRRRGKGTNVFRTHGFRYLGDACFRIFDEKERTDVVRGKVVDILHDPGRTAPLMKIKYEDKKEVLLPAPNGIKTGDVVESGINASIKVGNVLPLLKIPEGTQVSNIELRPGDGGKIVRASGGYATVITREADKVIVQLPSKELKAFNPNCRAMIGAIAGAGRTEKPFIKAGKKWYEMKSRGKYWPVVRGVAMSAYAHPYGGKGSRTKKNKTVSRRKPPGAKVGSIAAKRTGKK